MNNLRTLRDDIVSGRDLSLVREPQGQVRTDLDWEDVYTTICDLPLGQMSCLVRDVVQHRESQLGNARLDWILATTRSSGIFDIRKGLYGASAIPEAQEVRRLWHGMYRGNVTLLNGETGAGKSSILLNVSLYAALNRPLWDIPFGTDTPLRVLYIDAENSGAWADGDGGTTATRMERLGMGRPEGLYFHDGRDLDLSNPVHIAQLGELILEKEFDLVILDPIINLFNTKDENDNVEAARQMKALVTLARDTQASIVAVHHTGKMGEEFGNSGKFGRGASARAGAADVILSLRAQGRNSDTSDDDGVAEPQRTDVCRLKVEKDRRGSRYTSIYLKMKGNDKFERTSQAEFKSKGPSTEQKRATEQECAEDYILARLVDGKEHAATPIINSLRSSGVKHSVAKDALASLLATKRVTWRPGDRGLRLISLPPSASSSDIHHRISDGKTENLPKNNLIFLPGDPFSETEPQDADEVEEDVWGNGSSMNSLF